MFGRSLMVPVDPEDSFASGQVMWGKPKVPSSNSLPSAPVPQLREKPELIHPEVRARRGAAPSAARCRRHPGCMHLRSKRSLASPPASASDASNANAAALKRKRSELTDGSGSSLLRQLLNRQTDSAARASFPKRCFSQRFTNLKRRVTMDLYGLSHPPPGLNQMLHQRHRITELTVAEGIVLGLTENGVCVAYCMRTGRQLCVLNSSVAEVVRSLFHNKLNGTLITVSVYAADQFSCLRCRATALSHIREGVTTLATPLFTSESLRWPGFVEFDDVNGKVLTYSADQSVYKAWSLADPSKVLYSFSQSSVPPSGIEEVKISPGIMLLVCKYTQDDTSIPLRVLSVETGEVLRELRQPIRPGKKVDIIEQFNERLMLKQEGLPLHIIDLLTNRVVKVKHAFFRTPSAFIFLYENHSFLAFRENSITNWNFKGEMLHTFQDHALCFPIPDIDHTSVIYITQSQDLIISLCQDADHSPGGGEDGAGVSDAAAHGEGAGSAADGDAIDHEASDGDSTSSRRGGVSIHVSHIHSGKLIAKLDRQTCEDRAKITALCYSEESGDIITGNEEGIVTVWSS